jgi:hypothetical protein
MVDRAVSQKGTSFLHFDRSGSVSVRLDEFLLSDEGGRQLKDLKDAAKTTSPLEPQTKKAAQT